MFLIQVMLKEENLFASLQSPTECIQDLSSHRVRTSHHLLGMGLWLSAVAVPSGSLCSSPSFILLLCSGAHCSALCCTPSFRRCQACDSHQVFHLWCETSEMQGEIEEFSNRESSRWLIVFLGRERGLPEDSCGLQEIQHCFNLAVWLQFPRQAFQLHFLANRTFLGLSLQCSFSGVFALPGIRAGCFKELETSSSS